MSLQRNIVKKSNFASVARINGKTRFDLSLFHKFAENTIKSSFLKYNMANFVGTFFVMLYVCMDKVKSKAIGFTK